MSQLKEGARKDFPVLVKADVQGSAEAIVQALEKLGNEEVGARVMHYGVGGISESRCAACGGLRRRRARLQCARQRPGARCGRARTASRSATTTSSTISSTT